MVAIYQDETFPEIWDLSSLINMFCTYLHPSFLFRTLVYLMWPAQIGLRAEPLGPGLENQGPITDIPDPDPLGGPITDIPDPDPS